MLDFPEQLRSLLHRSVIDKALPEIDSYLAPDARYRTVVAVMKKALADGKAEIKRRFEINGDGRKAAHASAYLMDRIIQLLYDDAMRLYPASNPTLAEHLSVVGVGGYGRSELAPYSDIDILFLLPYRKTARCEQFIEHILYILWDLGIKIGHATRSIIDCLHHCRENVTSRTALLDARLICGEAELFLQLQHQIQQTFQTGPPLDFVRAKLHERDQRHERLGDSRYVLEPNIKEGKGGLRDLHTLMWLAKYVYRTENLTVLQERRVLTKEEATKFKKAHAFLWSLRFHLHYLAGRPEERLGFDMQTELARRMGYRDRVKIRGVERLMKHYFLVAKTVGDLTRLFCAALEAEQRKPLELKRLWTGWRRDRHGIALDGERIGIADADTFLADSVNMIRLFWLAERHDVDIHPAALRLTARHIEKVDAKLRLDQEANRLFLEILTSPNTPERSLRMMNEVGVFGRFIPDFGRIVAQMQYDMYHVYTVDEHTILAIGILSAIEHGQLKNELPLATYIFPQLISRRVLYVAILLHDIAKGQGGNHSELGARIAERLCPRLGLDEEETETAVWLVEHHLIMSNTAFRRDLHDPKTGSDFVAIVQSPERLRLLLILTVADIRAVGPKVWNNWKAGLLRELYQIAANLMQLDPEERAVELSEEIENIKQDLGNALSFFGKETVKSHLERVSHSYLLSTTRESLLRHANMVIDASINRSSLAITSEVISARGVTELTIYTADHYGLFARLAGAIADAGATIVDAHIYTLNDGMVLDSFAIQSHQGEIFNCSERLARLEALIKKALQESSLQLPRSSTNYSVRHPFIVKPRVLIDLTASQFNTVIEVNGRDRPGLLRDLGAILSSLSIQITSAKISTYGERAVDVFYVRNRFGLKIEHPHHIREIRAALLQVFNE